MIIALYSYNITLYGCNIPLYGCNISLYGCNIPLYGCNISLYGCNIPLYRMITTQLSASIRRTAEHYMNKCIAIENFSCKIRVLM